jgi:hypothetical protein
MIESLDNGQKQILKNMMYEKYFRVASDEQLRKDAHILQMYYDGELVESNHDDY